MPNLTVGKLRAIVEVDTSQLRKAKTSVKGFSGDIQSTFKDINRSIRSTALKATAFISLPLILFGTASVKAASDAVEMTNVFNVAFQNIRQESEKTANQLASDFDLASSTSKKLLGDVGDLMIGFGLTDKAALSLANRTLRIAGDLTSFRNIAGGIPKVTNAIFRGMLGISQALKPLGVAMNQRSKQFRAQIKEMMASRGLTEQIARAELVLQEVIKQSVNAVGDYNRTRGELANTSRRLGEMTKFMREEFGKILIQGLRLDVVIRILGTGMKILANVLSIIPGFLRPIIGAMVLLAIVIPPVVVAFAIFNLAVLHLQKSGIGLNKILIMQSGILGGFVIPAVTKAIVSFSAWAAKINMTTISLGGLKAATISAIISVKALTVSVKLFYLWLSPLLIPVAVLLGAVALAVGSIVWAIKRIKASMLKKDIAAINKSLKSTVSVLKSVWKWIKIISIGLFELFNFAVDALDEMLTGVIFDMFFKKKIDIPISFHIDKKQLGDINKLTKDILKNAKSNIATGKTFKGSFSKKEMDMFMGGNSNSFPKGLITNDVNKKIKQGGAWDRMTDRLSKLFIDAESGGGGGIGVGEGVGVGAVTPSLSSAAIRGTSEAVKIENQRSTNRKVEENTKKTANNTEKMANAFISNQVVLMPANLTA